MSELTAQQYYNELIEAGQANDFTKLTSTGISSNYQNVFAFAEDYFEARMQANEDSDNHEKALPINSVRLRFPMDYIEVDGYCDTDCEAVKWIGNTCDKLNNCGLKLGRCYKIPNEA